MKKCPDVGLGVRDEDLEFIDYTGSKKEENFVIVELKAALYNNLAACYLKLKEYPNAISACNEVLLIDPNKTKALLVLPSRSTLIFYRYRRAKALTQKGDAGLIEYRAARDDLKAAHKLDPKDQAIEQLYAKVRNELTSIERSQGIYVNDSGGPGDTKKVDKPAPEEHKSKPKVVEEKKTQGNNVKNKHPEKVVPSKKNEKADKVEIKQEKVIREKREEEKREETTSTLHTESGEADGKVDGNEVWKMLHGDVDPNSQDFSYSLSFEIDPKAKVPEEIQEFGRYDG